MKKLMIVLGVVFAVLICTQAFAAWEITASWTASIGPNLAREELVVGTTVVATVNAGQQTAHVFTMPALAGETVKVISYNTQGVPNAGYTIGTLTAIAPPGLATGGSIIIQWKP